MGISGERILAAVVAVGLLGAALAAARSSMRRWSTPIDVLPVFLLVWGTVLLLFAVPVIDYTRTPVVAWLMVYGSIGSTTLGCILARRFGAGGGTVATPSEGVEALRERLHVGRLRALWIVSCVLGLIGFAAFVYAVDRELGWQALYTNPEAVREAKRDSIPFQDAYGPWKLLTNFNTVAFVLWTVGLRCGAFPRPWRWARLAGVVSPLPFLVTADRGLLIALLTWAALVHLLWPMAVSWRRIAVIVLLGVLFAGFVVTAVGNRYGGSLEAHPEVAAHAVESVDALVIPYLYLTANIPTFGQLTLDRLAPTDYGQMTVLPLVKAAHAVGIPGTPPIGTGVFYPIPFESFSNYSWLGSFWLDLRAPGVLLLTAVLGLVAALWRARLAEHPSIASLWTASLLLFVVVLSPFANALTATLVWQYLLLGPFVAVAVDRRLAMRVAVVLRNRTRRVVAACCLIGAIAVFGAAAVTLSPWTTQGQRIDAMRELDLAIRKAAYIHSQDGRYPTSISLATRLQVNRPGVLFRAQVAYTEELPPPPAIAVFSGPKDVFLRVRTTDGRVFEAHRTEEYGGVTFGPGTRD